MMTFFCNSLCTYISGKTTGCTFFSAERLYPRLRFNMSINMQDTLFKHFIALKWVSDVFQIFYRLYVVFCNRKSNRWFYLGPINGWTKSKSFYYVFLLFYYNSTISFSFQNYLPMIFHTIIFIIFIYTLYVVTFFINATHLL